MQARSSWAPWIVAGVLLVGGVAGGQDSTEQGSVATLPEMSGHEVWVTDRLLSHAMLFDGDSGEALGTVDSGATLTPKPPLYSPERGEFYSVDIAYSRFRRGDRIDFVTIYDAVTLDVAGEVVLPTRTAESNTSFAHTGLLDGARFLAVFNQFPHTSVSVVDLEARSFAGEIVLAGCAGVYPIGPERFASLCGDGTLVAVTLDGAGRKAALVRSAAFFDAVADPAFMQAARHGSRWIFVSFEGQVHEVDFSGGVPEVAEPWSLFGEAGDAQGWRVGGLQHVAVHPGTNRLYTVLHEGGPGSHKAPGPEVWVHDLGSRERVARFAMPNLAVAFLGGLMGLEDGGFGSWVLEQVVPNQGVHSIVVTRDESPLLFARNAELGAVAVVDAITGEHLRSIGEVGIAGPTLEVP